LVATLVGAGVQLAISRERAGIDLGSIGVSGRG
jgi:hypothetical protein